MERTTQQRRAFTRREAVQVGVKLAYVTPLVVAIAELRPAGAFTVSTPDERTPARTTGSSPPNSTGPVAPRTSRTTTTEHLPPAEPPPGAPPAESTRQPPLPKLPKAGTGGLADQMPRDP